MAHDHDQVRWGSVAWVEYEGLSQHRIIREVHHSACAVPYLQRYQVLLCVMSFKQTQIALYPLTVLHKLLDRALSQHNLDVQTPRLFIETPSSTKKMTRKGCLSSPGQTLALGRCKCAVQLMVHSLRLLLLS